MYQSLPAWGVFLKKSFCVPKVELKNPIVITSKDQNMSYLT